MFRLKMNVQNKNDVHQLSKSNMVVGMKVAGDLGRNTEICEGCVFGKMTRALFPKKSQNRASSLLEIVHTDLVGPMQVLTHGGSKYVLTFTDDY